MFKRMKKRSIYLWALWLIPLLAACAPTPEEQMTRARQSLSENRYSAARLDLVSVLVSQPGNTVALELLARVQLASGDGDAARETLSKLSATGKLPADTAVLLGESELLRKNYQGVLSAVESDLTADAYRLRGLVQLAMGKTEEAGRTFVNGRGAPGAKARLNAESALFLLRSGDLSGARALAAQALKEAPTGLDALIASARVATASGQLREGLGHFEQAVKSHPESFAAQVGRAATLGDLGRTKEMAPLIAQLADAAPNDPSIRYLQARMAAERKDWDAVRATIQPIEAEFDTLPEAQLLYSQALVELALHNQALAQLHSYLGRRPNNRIAMRLLGECQLATGDAKGALATLLPLAHQPQATPEELRLAAQAARSAGSPDAGRLSERARFPAARLLASDIADADAALQRKDWQAAANAYRRLMQLSDGENALVLNNLAYAESQLGNTDKALELARRALREEPTNPSIMDTLGWLKVSTGNDRAGGISLLRKASSLAPGNATIASHLAEATGK